MNPLVQEMLNTVAGQDTELVFLEGLLEDDCKCESLHTETSCSNEVTHLVIARCCDKRWRVCLNSAEHTRVILSRRTCGHCFSTLISNCWTIRPI